MNLKTYSYEDRLVEFASDCISYCRTLPKSNIGTYYFDQILRSSGSAALHYGEAQGTRTKKDFVYKVSNTVKELKETRVALKILNCSKIGNEVMRIALLKEVEELIAIGMKMIINKKSG